MTGGHVSGHYWEESACFTRNSLVCPQLYRDTYIGKVSLPRISYCVSMWSLWEKRHRESQAADPVLFLFFFPTSTRTEKDRSESIPIPADQPLLLLPPHYHPSTHSSHPSILLKPSQGESKRRGKNPPKKKVIDIRMWRLGEGYPPRVKNELLSLSVYLLVPDY